MLKEYCFRNYDDFKEIFGYRKTNNGKMVRKNKILLSLYKNGNDKPLRKFLEEETNYKRYRLVNRLFTVSTIQELDSWFICILKSDAFVKGECFDCEYLMDRDYKFYYDHTKWFLNEDGRCTDANNMGNISYIEFDGSRNRETCCSPARFLKKIMENYFTIFQLLPLPIIRHFEELFAEDWKAYVKSFEDIQLVVNNTDFYKIYDSYYLEDGDSLSNGIFNSCMVDKDLFEFYESLPDCQCAYLLKNDKIVARCIIFKAYKCDDPKYSYYLAERQYSANSDDSLKKLLIDKLIEGKYIDGYKKIGAECYDRTNFILVNDESLSLTDLFIETDEFYDIDRTFPYMDSFCYYNHNLHRAYNSDYYHDYTHKLTNTDGNTEFYGEWSNYYGRYLYYGEEYQYVDYFQDYILEEDLVLDTNNNYILMEDAEICPHCDNYFREGYYSSLTGMSYCCASCKEEAEKRWNKEHNEEIVIREVII